MNSGWAPQESWSDATLPPPEDPAYAEAKDDLFSSADSCKPRRALIEASPTSPSSPAQDPVVDVEGVTGPAPQPPPGMGAAPRRTPPAVAPRPYRPPAPPPGLPPVKPRRGSDPSEWYQPKPGLVRGSVPRPNEKPTASATESLRAPHADVPPDTAPAPTKPKQSLKSFIGELVAIIAVGLLITTVLRAFVFQPFEVPSGSMENTLQVNDKIVALRVIDFHRGDVVVFADTNGWLGEQPRPGPIRQGLEFVGILPNSAEGHLVKRVIGLPGDRVACCDAQGRITVNGHPLAESAYLYSDASGQVKPAEHPFEVVVPDRRLFVLGDHRNASGDSRCHLQDVSMGGGPAGGSAFVPTESVVGTVTLIISPLNRIQRLQTPTAFAGVPPPSGSPPAQPEIARVPEGC